MANFSRSAKSGTLTRKQVNMFKGIKDGKVFAEAMNADSRTEQRKYEDQRVKIRSEEHTSELQSQAYLVCRLLLEKKKKKQKTKKKKQHTALNNIT